MDPSGASVRAAVVPYDNNYSKSQNDPSPTPLDCSDPIDGPECGLQLPEADFREQKIEESYDLPKEQRGWRKLVRNFTPS
jgi:hypothetical protein